MQETELKAIISENQYNMLETKFLWDSIKEQTNSYYISPDNSLKRNGITFRIRTIDNKHTIQIKKHPAKDRALQISDESEYEIDHIPYEFNQDEVNAYTGISVPVSLIGELTTLRHSFMFSDGVEICLDKSFYLGQTDYEIEIEYTKPIPDELFAKLSDIGIDFSKKCVGKFSRFMNRLGAL